MKPSVFPATIVFASRCLRAGASGSADKPNTYADCSAQTFYLTTHALAEVLRGWPLSDYEEKQVLMAHKSRQALAIARTAMVRDQEITQGRAMEIAHRVMRDNAMALYGLGERR